MQSTTLPGRQPTTARRPGAGAGGGSAAASRRFPADAASVGQARRFLLGRLPEGRADDADALVLMLSELATNAVRHAATEFEVTVHVVGETRQVVVEVTDAAGGYPTPQEPAADAPRGRGLHIVRTLADAWGIEMQRDRPGKTVWFSSTLPAGTAGGRADGRRPRRGDVGPAKAAFTAAHPARPAGGRAVPSGRRWSSRTGPCPPCGRCSTASARPIVATDEHGLIHYANVTAEELMGWPRGSLVGRSALDLVPDALMAPFEEGFESFVRSQAARPRGAAPAGGHQALRRVGGPHRAGPEHVRPSPGGAGRGRHLPRPRRPAAAAMVRAHERAARDPGRRTDRRPSGGAAAVDPRAAPRLGRDHAVGPLREPGAGLPPACGPARRSSPPPSRTRRRSTRPAAARDCPAGSSSTASRSGSPT